MCPNLNHSHKALTKLYRDIDSIKGVRHSYIGSGVRYDLLMDEKGFLDEDSRVYFKELISRHISGRFKVAPEHTEDHILNLMNKPSFSLFVVMKKEFEKICAQTGLNQQIIPYFISSHPGCTNRDMQQLAAETRRMHYHPEQVQDFTPTPMTLSTTMYYTGLNPYTMQPVYVARTPEEKRQQNSYFFWWKNTPHKNK